MSISAIKSVHELTREQVPTVQMRAVLLVLADCANEDLEAWPSVDIICQRTSMVRRMVFRQLDRLRDAGILEVVRNNSRKSKTYRLTILCGISHARVTYESPVTDKSPVTYESQQGCTIGHPKVTYESPQGDLLVTQTIIEQSVNDQENPNTGEGAQSQKETGWVGYADWFLEFWKTFPSPKGNPGRKKDRKKCEVKLRKFAKNQEAADRIFQALLWWKESAEWTKEAGRFIPAPLTWIHGQRWEDVAPSEVCLTTKKTDEEIRDQMAW